MRLTAILVTLVTIGAGTLTGCSSTDSSSATGGGTTIATTTTPAPTPDIVISNYAYAVRGPVRPGQQVVIVNDDQASHSVATDSNDVDVRISGGGGIETFTAPTTPGTYEIHCKYHANMHGTLTVQ